MSLESAYAVIDRMEADEAFATQVRDAGGPDASIAILTSEGFDVTPDELRDAVLDRYGDQLTPEQLDALGGGAMNEGDWIMVAGTLGGIAISVGAVVAAAAV